MKVLMFDVSTDYLYVRFYDSKLKECFFSKDMISHNKHSENLLVVIEEGLKECNFKLSEFDRIIIGNGPGSYTGLRIGMVVGKMLSYTLDIPLYTISSLSFVSSGHLFTDGMYAQVIIAKKLYSYLKVTSVENGKAKVMIDDCFLSDDEKEKIVCEYNATIIDEQNYLINEEYIFDNCVVVENIHELVPNYLRKANS